MTDTAPPPVGPRGAAIRVAVQGADAYRAGIPVNGCPYGATRPFSRRAWVVGWTGAAREAGAVLPGSVEPDHDTPWPGTSAPEAEPLG